MRCTEATPDCAVYHPRSPPASPLYRYAKTAKTGFCGAADKAANFGEGEGKSPWRQLLESDA